VHFSPKAVVVIALLALAAGFAAGWSWRRHTHPSPAEQWDRASKDLRKGLLGE
jgi:hypothetical protein